MAQPITLDAPVEDPRLAVQNRLRDAPAAHAEALLSLYEVIQGLHDRGVLDLLRGALGSRDKVLDVIVEAANAPAAIRSIRNLILLANALGSVDPHVLRPLTEAIPEALNAMVCQPERPGLWALINDFFWNQDFRHGMAAMNMMIEALGRTLARAQQAKP